MLCLPADLAKSPRVELLSVPVADRAQVKSLIRTGSGSGDYE